jgi:hypothetical protein
MGISNYLDQVALIERNSPVPDGVGAPQAVWTTRIASVPCAIWPASARVVTSFAALDSVAQFEMCTTVDVGCTTQDRVTINGKIYYVIGYMPFLNARFPQNPFLTILGKRNQP